MKPKIFSSCNIIPLLLFLFLPVNNQVFAQWDKYPTYDEYLTMMSQFETDYPNVCTIVEYGQSVNGRKLLAAKISDSVSIQEKEPCFLYHATIHGDETLGYMLMLRLIDYLLSNYGTDDLVTKLVDNVEICFAPLVNPDGTYQDDNSTVNKARRHNANNKDLNRNWPCWCMEDDHKYYGMYESWEPEVKALKDFFESNNFVMSADIHLGMLSVMYPSKHIEEVDKEWYLYVCHMYADTASKYSPSGYDLEVTNDNDTLSYIAHGSWTYYANIYRHCRNINLELSVRKLVGESQLNDYWDCNYRSLLNYIQQVLYGVRGTVTDTVTGVPLNAKVFVENHDKDSSFVYSHLPHGDYYRPVYEGTYDVTFSAEDFYSKTISGVTVENGKATVLNVELTPRLMGSKYITINNKPEILINSHKKGIQITCTNIKGSIQATIYDLSGRLVRTLRVQPTAGYSSIAWNGLNNGGKEISTGCYIIQIQTSEKIISKHFLFSQ